MHMMRMQLSAFYVVVVAALKKWQALWELATWAKHEPAGWAASRATRVAAHGVVNPMYTVPSRPRMGLQLVKPAPGFEL